MDDYVYWLLACWAKKRHNNKTKKWRLFRYWHELGSRKFVFSENNSILKKFCDTPIVRHYWLNTNKNPYTDESYFNNIKEKQKMRKYQAFKETVASNLCVNKLDVLEA